MEGIHVEIIKEGQLDQQQSSAHQFNNFLTDFMKDKDFAEMMLRHRIIFLICLQSLLAGLKVGTNKAQTKEGRKFYHKEERYYQSILKSFMEHEKKIYEL